MQSREKENSCEVENLFYIIAFVVRYIPLLTQTAVLMYPSSQITAFLHENLSNVCHQFLVVTSILL